MSGVWEADGLGWLLGGLQPAVTVENTHTSFLVTGYVTFIDLGQGDF